MAIVLLKTGWMIAGTVVGRVIPDEAENSKQFGACLVVFSNESIKPGMLETTRLY
jgi:hypothetical protein